MNLIRTSAESLIELLIDPDPDAVASGNAAGADVTPLARGMGRP